MRNIYLIGFMGCGKSTIAKIMKEDYHLDLIEMDEEIEKRAQKTIVQIFAQDGEEVFRQQETSLLEEISEREHCVVSCGGGTILRKRNRELMKESGAVIWLTASAETILKRIRNSNDRPLLNNRKTLEDIEKMMNERRIWYQEAAQIHVDTEQKSKKEIAKEIMKRIGAEIC